MKTTDGINSESQQRINRALVIDLLRKEGVCSRAKLADISKLRRATITNIINDFIASGLVIETGKLDSMYDRRSRGIRLNGKNFRVIGAMLTRKQYCLVSMGLSGEIYDRKEFAIGEGEEAQTIISRMKASIHKMIQTPKENRTLAIGISVPGPYKRDQDKLVFVSSLAGWDGVHILEELQKAFTIPVFVENDANAGAYALLWNEQNEITNKNLVYIVAGQGIGCGVVADGRILTGEDGLAGEIGHTCIEFRGNQCECGNTGCLETYCSTIAIEKKLQECIEKKEKTMLQTDFVWEDFVNAVQEGDEIAAREYKSACKFLAVGIINIINQLNPGLVVIGDQLAEVNPALMYEIIHEEIRKAIRPLILEGLKIEINNSRANPVLIGAAAIAGQKVLENPFDFIKQNDSFSENEMEVIEKT